MRKIHVILLAVILFMPSLVKAENIEIITYNSEININQNRTVDITEKYLINFLSSEESIGRSFTTDLNYRRDSEEKNIKILVNDVESSSKYVFEDNNLTFDVTGTKGVIEQYQTSYTYDYGIDKNEEYDDVYINIVDGNFESNISQINFSISFEPNTNIKKIKFFVNGSTDPEELIETDNIIIDEEGLVTYTYENDILSGNLSKFLEEGQTLSVYIEFEDNYFKDANDIYSSYWMMYLIIAPLLSLLIGIFSWIKYGKKNKFNLKEKQEIKSTYNSAEMAYMYKGHSIDKDLISVLIELANEGYIMFTESEDGYKLGGANTFIIKKLKDYDKNSAIKKIFFDKMFLEKDEITTKDIEYNMYTELVQAKFTLDNDKNKKELFNEKVPLIKKIMIGLILTSILIFTFYPSYLLTGVYFIFPVVGAVLFLGIYILFMYDDMLAGKLLFGFIIIGGLNFLLIRPLLAESFALIVYIIGSVIIYASSYIYSKLSTRTKKGNELYNEANAYKNLLQKISSKEIKENPEYYYELYSYIYVFDLFDEWNNKAKNTVKEYPNWYQTKEDFSLKNFEKFIKNMVYTISQSMYKNNGFDETTTHVEFEKKVNVKQMD